MNIRWAFPCALALAIAHPAFAQHTIASAPEPLAIGQTFTITSDVLGETRRINVYLPHVYGAAVEGPLPVLYIPDGGVGEDFVHVAGLVHISVSNGSMRPFLLVGIENTVRRRDLTGPTSDPEDRKIAPQVGGSAAFRRFIRQELMPVIDTRYSTTGETAIMGESLAGLFVIETLLSEPDLFDTYIAFDPSLWWNRAALVDQVSHRKYALSGRSLYFASSNEPELAALAQRFADTLATEAPAGAVWHYQPMPEESHATIYHPAALRALRSIFAPVAMEQ